MNIHLFGKVGCPFVANWTINKTAIDQSGSFDQIYIKPLENDFTWTISVAIKVCIDVINILQKGVFRLTKFN